MSIDKSIERARSIAAALAEADGKGAQYIAYLREGAYDDSMEVRIAHTALIYAHGQQMLAIGKEAGQ